MDNYMSELLHHQIEHSAVRQDLGIEFQSQQLLFNLSRNKYLLTNF
jgi:hypothetical protein